MIPTAIVILNFNGQKLLQQFLPSVIQHSQKAEIIVADNGSTDQSVAILEKEFPTVKIIRLDKNYGFCGGYNRALQQVKASYYVLLNSDVEVTAQWLDPLINLMDRDHTIAAVQPKILAYARRNTFEYAGAAGGFIDTLGYPFCRGRIFTTVEEDHSQYNDEREVFWATGACFVIRAEVYHQFGGFDEDFFAHMEEIDLCWKLHRAGHKVYYCGKSSVYHVGAGTLGYESPRKTYLNFRNGLSLIYKHLNPGELVYKLPLRMTLDWVASITFLLSGQFQNSCAVFKAHLHFLGNIKRDSRKRSAIRNQYPTYSRTGVYPGSIIADYYLRGKKKM